MAYQKKAYIEITNICNLSCDFCPQTTREKGFISLGQAKEIAKQLCGRVAYVFLHLLGEPLLHPDLLAIIQIFKAAELLVNIVTNGVLITQQSDVLLLSKPRKVSFSLHSQNFKDKERYLQDIFDFTKAARLKNIIVELRMWRGGEPEVLASIEKYFGFIPPMQSKGVKMGDCLYLSVEGEFLWPTLCEKADSLQYEDKFCLALRDQFGILLDGTVVPCCLDYNGAIPLGNIYNQPLDEILNSKRASKIYNGFSLDKAVEPLCKNCSFASVRADEKYRAKGKH